VSFLYLIVCDDKSYYRKDLTFDEAVELGKRAIMHATHRDAMSGGINNGTLIRLVHLEIFLSFNLVFFY